MREYLLGFCRRYDYPSEAVQDLSRALDALCKIEEFNAFYDEVEREYAKDARYPFRERLTSFR